jgi:hypothetical protein
LIQVKINDFPKPVSGVNHITDEHITTKLTKVRNHKLDKLKELKKWKKVLEDEQRGLADDRKQIEAAKSTDNVVLYPVRYRY